MPTQPYFTADRTRVPSVTTICGRFKDSSALMLWSFRQGQKYPEATSPYQEAQEAASIGTVVHGMIEHYFNPTIPPPAMNLTEEQAAKAGKAYGAFLDWIKLNRVEMVAQEIPLVSERHRYGGCPDGIAVIGNALCLIDYKTSGGVYADHLIQLAAYRELWNECNPDRPLTGGSHLLRISKEFGDFEHRHFDDLTDAFEQFLLFRRAYEVDKVLRKRAA